MYDLKTIKKALKLLKQYDYKFIKVSRAMNIKVNTLRSWHKKESYSRMNKRVCDSKSLKFYGQVE